MIESSESGAGGCSLMVSGTGVVKCSESEKCHVVGCFALVDNSDGSVVFWAFKALRLLLWP